MQYLTAGDRLYEVHQDAEVENFGLTRSEEPTLRVVIVRDLQQRDDNDRVPNNYCERCRTIYGAENHRLPNALVSVSRPVVAAA